MVSSSIVGASASYRYGSAGSSYGIERLSRRRGLLASAVASMVPVVRAGRARGTRTLLVEAAASTVVRCRRGHLLTCRRHRVPEAAEGVHALAARVARACVAGERVERVAVVGHLRLAVRALGGRDHRG